MVEGFLADGWTVAGGARSEPGIAALREKFGDGGHFFGVLDVALDDSAANFCKEGLGAAGVPDLLVNNAALINTPTPLGQGSLRPILFIVRSESIRGD